MVTTCGIAGFALSPDESVNTKRLAKVLFLDIESRGTDATGFAFRDSTGLIQVHKRDMPASQFVKRHLCLPRNTRTAIMHTRLATQGQPEWNVNNHPIEVENIVGVHNGMLWNDAEIWRTIKPEVAFDGVVDSAAIFALLADRGYDPTNVGNRLEEVMGSAAIAWLDKNDEPDTLHLARLNQSPLVIATTTKGSSIFASTKSALEDAALLCGLEYTHIRDQQEGDYLLVKDGRVEDVRKFMPCDDSWTQYHYSGSRSNYRTHVPVKPHRTLRPLTGLGLLDDPDEYEWEPTAGAAPYGERKPTKVQVANIAASNHVIPIDVFRPEELLRLSDPADYQRVYHKREKAVNDWFADREGLVTQCVEEYGMTEVEALKAYEAEAILDFHAYMRPGDIVKVTVSGEWRYGSVVSMPLTFPDGNYVIRAFVPRHENGSDDKFYESSGYEAVLVQRTASEIVALDALDATTNQEEGLCLVTP